MNEQQSVNTSLISVVVPVYNRENTIRRCIDSILSSKYENIELIIVDDGSTDGSWNIIQSYQDQRIKAYYTSNRGVCAARNTGIENATGEYISFVDSDDFVTPDAYYTLGNIIQKCHPDMIAFNHGVYFENNGNKFDSQPLKITQNELLGREYILNRILPVLVNLKEDKELFIHNFIWNKLYKRSILNAYHIRFDEARRRWEDRIFQICYLKYAQTFYYCPQIGYYYVLGNSSFSQKYDPAVFKFILSAKENYKSILGDTLGSSYDFDSGYSNSYYCKTINNTVLSQFNTPDIDEKQHRADIKEMLLTKAAQELYLKSTAETSFEKAIKEAVETKQVNVAYDLFKKEYLHREQEKQKAIKLNRSIFYRVVRKIFSMIKFRDKLY